MLRKYSRTFLCNRITSLNLRAFFFLLHGIDLESVRKTLLMSMSGAGASVNAGGGSIHVPGQPINFEQEKGSATDAERLAMKSPKKIAIILERLLTAHYRLGKSAIPTLPLEMVVAECLE